MESKVSFRNLFTEPTKNGLTRPKRVRGSGVYMVNMGELFAHRRIGPIEMDRVPLSPAESSFLLQPDDLLFARQSLVLSGAGQCSIFLGHDEPVTFESHLIRCRINKAKADPRFLFYLFGSSVGRQILEPIIQQGAGASGLKASDLACVELPNVPLPTQISIANCLSSLDDRIDHNRALAAKLEAIARRLFKSWFVDFDPVRAKAACEEPAGLADDIAALFPDRLVDSELGETPDGWKVGKISDFSTNVRIGCTPSQFSSEDFYVGLEHFDRRCLTLWNGGSGDDATSNKSRFSKGDLLFGKLRPYFHKVAIAPTGGICSTDILVIRCTDSAYREFMYLSLFQDEVIQYVSDASGGTRMPRTNWETLAGYACVIPSRPVALAFGEIVAPMIETMMQCVSENAALTKIRDLLLPRLISGKLRVADAESLIEEAIA